MLDPNRLRRVVMGQRLPTLSGVRSKAQAKEVLTGVLRQPIHIDATFW